MAVLGVFGYTLLAAGPGVVLWSCFIGTRSFLVLLGLASSFTWLVILLGVSVILSPFVGVESPAILALLLVVSVALQEAGRFGVYHAQRRLAWALSGIAQQRSDLSLTPADHSAMAFAHGMGHGWTHLVFFYLCWLPLASGDGTLYLDACPHMSYFLYTALASMGMFLLHAFSMPVAFAKLDEERSWSWAIIPGLHGTAALLTLLNLIHNGCLATAPLLVALPAVPLYLWWRQAGLRSEDYTAIE